MEQALAYWRGRGVQNEDIVLGVPFYGRSFDSGSLCQPFTQTGSASYADLLAMEQSGDWKRHWSTAARVPWLEERQGSGIWSYENARSVREKALFALKEDVAGVMIWELTHDVVRDKHLLLEALTEPLLR